MAIMSESKHFFQEKECNEKDGWCLENTVEKVRKKMIKAIIQFLERERLKGTQLKYSFPLYCIILYHIVSYSPRLMTKYLCNADETMKCKNQDKKDQSNHSIFVLRKGEVERYHQWTSFLYIPLSSLFCVLHCIYCRRRSLDGL